MNSLYKIDKGKFLVFTSIFYLLVGIFAFGYGVSGNKLGVKGDKTFTISDSLEYGNKNFIIPCLLLSYLFTVILLKTKCKMYILLRIFLLTVAFIFFIVICWYTPSKNMDLHRIFAGIIISCIAIFTFISLFTLSYISKYITIITVIFTLIIITMFISASNSNFTRKDSTASNVWTDVFAGLEITVLIIYVLILLLIGTKN